MKNLDKLKIAKKQYDELEEIRIKASNLMDNELYDICVHFHYNDKISISCSAKNNNPGIWAQFYLIGDDVTVIEQRNYSERQIDEMICWIENWIDG